MILKKKLSQTVYLVGYTSNGVHYFPVRYTNLSDKQYQDFTLPSYRTKQVFICFYR